MRQDYKCAWCNYYHSWPKNLGIWMMMFLFFPIFPLLWYIHYTDEEELAKYRNIYTCRICWEDECECDPEVL